MAINWFKKKKHQKEETIPSDQKIDNTSETLETENIADTQQASENNIAREQLEHKYETSHPPHENDQETDQTGSKKPSGFFSRLKRGLSKTREILTTDINDLFSGNRKIDEELLEDLEELLITSDIGSKRPWTLFRAFP